MANQFYAAGAEKTLGKLIDWENDDIRVVALSTGYTFNQSAHEFLDDVSAFALSSGLALTGKSIAGGVFDADDIDITVTAGVIKGFAFYVHDADPAAAALLIFIDNVIGFPVTTSGGVMPIEWQATGIFDLLR